MNIGIIYRINFFKKNFKLPRVLDQSNISKHQRKLLCTKANSNCPVVLSEKLEKIMLIGINRPEKKNCVNLDTALKLKEAFDDFENDADMKVAVLHGIGGNFCSGFDLTQISSIYESPEELPKFENGLGLMGPSRMLTEKPLIAAISGYAVAGGLELALLCDLRIMDENAVLGVFCRRFGVPLIDGGTVRLPKLIGLSRAMDLILTGRPVQGKEALEIGLVNRCVHHGSSLGQAINLAHNIAKFPQQCVKADKKSTYYSTFDAVSMEDALNFELINGLPIVAEEGLQGAENFKSGIGKHGSFNLNKKNVYPN